MRNIKKALALCLTLPVFLTGCGTDVTTADESPALAESVTVPARPQDDFYRYVNEEELEGAEFEYGAYRYSPLNGKEAEDEVKGIIRDIAAGSGYEPATEEYVIKTAYDLYRAYDFDNAPIPEDLNRLFHEIDNASNVDELLAIDAKLQMEYGVDNFFNIGIGTNCFRGGEQILNFYQFINVLDVDFEDLEDSYRPLNTLKKYGSDLMQAMGHDKEYSDNAGISFGYLAMDIYNHTDIEIMNSENPYSHFKVYSYEEVSALMPDVDLMKYLKAWGIDEKYCDKFGLTDAGQLEVFSEIFKEENLDALKAWEMAALASKYRRFIANGYDNLKKYAIVDYYSEEERAVNEIYAGYTAMTDPIYVEKYYTKEMDDELIRMCDDIREGYRVLITNADWLSPETREGLLKKLDNIVYVTGADSERNKPDILRTFGGRDYYEFYRSYTRNTMIEKRKLLDELMDREEVTMPFQTMNASYDPSLNNINITVAIMHAPYFDMDEDYYSNLGGLGMIIGHEIGHAFDSAGILFDDTGKYDPSWIPEEDYNTLVSRNEQAVKYFEDNFTVFGVYHVDGELTLGENYADLSSLECLTVIAKEKQDREKLFEGFAKGWAEKRVDAALLEQLENDCHSPALIRVNATLSTLDAFYETYDVTEGDGMYIPPEDRISRWY